MGAQKRGKSAKASFKEGPGVCRHCLKWLQFGESCWVYWPGKKVCPSKVETKQEWEVAKELLEAASRKKS